MLHIKYYQVASIENMFGSLASFGPPFGKCALVVGPALV
jgi:hypothetical protein